MSAPGTKGRNQHLQARGDRRAKEGRDAWREQLQISQLMKRLVDCGKGRISLNPTQIKALEVVVDRLVPRLSATGVVETNELDSLSREEILGRIRAIPTADVRSVRRLQRGEARRSRFHYDFLSAPSALLRHAPSATGFCSTQLAVKCWPCSFVPALFSSVGISRIICGTTHRQ